MSPRVYGVLPTGETVEAYTLAGTGGLSLDVITYGGIVTCLHAPDHQGRLANIVLGHDHLADYLADTRYLGAIVGRVAGRISNARFTLDGTVHSLAANDASNHLHGGICGFDKHLWKATPLARTDRAPSLRLSRLSPDGEEGYPGDVSVSVTYTVTPENAFVIETAASTNRATPFSLTHHAYFNLAGIHAGPAAHHRLQVHADSFAPADTRMRLLGRRDAVTTENDFRQPRVVGDAAPLLFQQHGDLYFLPPRSHPTELRVAARLVDPTSGRILTVHTTEDCLQLYVGAALRPTQSGICLECEGYPDGANTPALGNIILRPGQTLHHTTIYAFSHL